MNMEMKFSKRCPNCENIQSYTTKYRFERSIREQWVCNGCSSVHKKKTYDNEIIKQIILEYDNGLSYSKIVTLVKVNRDNVKNVLIENGVWVDGRDNIKKEFNDDEINDIINKYINEKLGCDTIGKYYNVTKRPINRVLKEKGLLREGLSNGVKIDLTDKQKDIIKKLYIEEYKNPTEISKELNLTKPFINKFLSNCGYRRNIGEGTSIGLVKRWGNRSYDEYLKNLSEFKKYKKKVMSVTRKQPIHKLLNYEKRGVSGLEGNYHLDHRFSILEGFIQNISPDMIGGIKNLLFIPWEENVKKRTKCSITINEIKI
jgi:transposase-like protein